MNDAAAPDAYLDRAAALLDWPALAPWIAAVEAKVGLPVAIALYKMILLERWFQLSGAELDDACHARATFRRFLGAPLHGPVAEVWMHRQYAPKLAAANVEVGKLISAVELMLADRGLAPPTCSWTNTETAELMQPNAGIRTTVFEPGKLAAWAAQAESSAREIASRARTVPLLDPAQFAPASPGAAEGERSIAAAVILWPWGGTTAVDAPIRVGRDPEFSPVARQLWADPRISRRHAEFTPAGGGVAVRDLGSANGTFLGTQRLPAGEQKLLADDARLRFGPHLTVKLVFYPGGPQPRTR
jgi:hypothetical protein